MGNYKPKTKEKSETREEIIKQNQNKFNKILYGLTHDGIYLNKLKELLSMKLGGNNNPKLGGVYQIICVKNNKFYIGSTKDLILRLNQHLNHLNKNIHENSHLQRAYKLEGPSKFKVKLIEEIPYKEDKYKTEKDYLKYIRKREKFYLDLFNCCDSKIGYNICSKTDTVYANPKKLLQEGKLKYSEEFILEICELMMDDHYSLIEISKMKNIPYSMVKDINQHRIYEETIKNYNFPKRNNKKL